MVDFINEVEEELRKDDYNNLLKKYGPLIAAIIAAIVIGTGYLEWREYSEDRAARATSASYTDAARLAGQGEVDKAVSQFTELASVAPQGYAGLSLMRAAIIELERGNRAQAVSLYDQAADKFEAPRHKQLAQLKAAYILAGDGAYQDVVGRVGPLTETGAPYEFLARELLGFAAAETGDAQQAREQFGYLNTVPGVPATIKERAKQSLTLMQDPAPTNTMASPDPVLASPDTMPDTDAQDIDEEETPNE
ncbi:tetratricopeptide repeat protein [Litorimonas sp. RW-G-Af-16]|uniref:tetratricopeptide repeat protein n=1 Tax=Litorimonas sp. RW-G-Af-16 TaxID=3241168 RepID=UPI00390C7A6D